MIHANTVLGFLEGWGQTAREDKVWPAVGILLGRLAERGVPILVHSEGQGLTFSMETLDRIRDAILTMQERWQAAGTRQGVRRGEAAGERSRDH